MATKSLSEEGLRFLEKYFSENDFPLTRHHIDSYEQCIFEEIPTIIHASNPIVFLKGPLDEAKTVFAYRVEIYIGGDAPTPDGLGIKISAPTVTLDEGNTIRRLFPNEARLRNMTYSAQVSADILIRVTLTQPNPTNSKLFDTDPSIEPLLIPNFPLFRIPILLRSRLCATVGANESLLEEMGECRNDHGGYFVINGAEKILITREEQAFNSLYVDKMPDSDEKNAAYASVVSLHPETKQTRRVALYLQRSGEIRVAVPMIRGAFPLFILFRALGVESDEEIVRMIYPEPSPMEELLVDCIEDAYPIHNRYTAIRYIMTLTKGYTEAHVLDILQNLMLPHVPNEPLTRAQYLAEMTREILAVNAGTRSKTDRDDMRAQRFLTTGTLLRELFNGSWKDWRAEVILMIDRTYRRNEQIYQGSAVLDLFASGNLVTMFQPMTLNNAIMRGFRGRWGTNERNEKTGVLQPLARISYLDAMSHTRRVVSDFDSSMKTTGPRKLHTSQVGYFCTSETPTGAHIGVTKNMSMMTLFSLGSPMKPLYDWLKAKGGLIPVAETTAEIRATAATVQINGGTVGFTTEPRELTQTLKLMKWNGCISPMASIAFNTVYRTVNIFLDEGRPVRPLWHLNGEGAAFLDRIPELLKRSWHSLVFGTSAAAAKATMRTTHFFDPLIENPAATHANYVELLAPTAGFIEYCDPMEMNENYISWWGGEGELTTDHTHCEIHPSTLTGLLASMIPFSNHNQAPRNQLSCSQSKQGIGYMATNIHSRYDTYSHQLMYGEAPLCRTFYYEAIANGEMPYGFNCIIAATSESGYNQDDGLIINRDSVARGMFQSLAFRTYDCAEEVDSMTKVHSHIANPGSVPTWSSLRPGYDYSKLDERGVIRVGEIVDEHTVLVGRYMVIPDTNDVKDNSAVPGLHTGGRVDSVVFLHQPEGILVKVRIIELRTPQLGDKFSSRHGQKGTIGMLVDAADLPRTADGLVPDVMVNPGGLISRMTVAQLVEMVAGRAAVEVVAKFNATTFCNGGDTVTQLGDLLQGFGASRAGDAILYSGVTGAQLRTDIFMCPLYFMRLKHLTDDKVNARGVGRREIRTHQPTGGRSNEGGLRIGEMERDSLCAHGIATFLQESMMKRGDETQFWICNGCGRIPIYNEPEGFFVCPTCDGPLEYTGLTADTLTLLSPTKQSRATFSRVSMPYTLKLVDQEMTSLGNMGFRFVTEASVARLREESWNWPSMDLNVEFKPSAGAIKDAPIAAAVAEAKKLKRKKTTESAAAPPPETLVRFSNTLKNEYAGFSNFATTPFRITGAQIPAPDGTAFPDPGMKIWPTVEHYYQAMKFATDPAWQENIRQAPSPGRAKKRGLDPAHALRGDWDVIKERVMKAALLTKFQQNPSQLLLLQATGDKKLIYTSPADVYWGDGARGKGKNRLGVLLEEVRTELKDVRVDQTLLAVPAAAANAANAEVEEGAAENIGAENEDAVAGAVAGAGPMINLADGVGGQMSGGGKGPTNGVYLFINSQAPGSLEPKARRQRYRDQPISWQGQSGGGGGDQIEQMTTQTQTSGPVEVSVEKLG
jgi:DNA-directed RNA polymerase II subunit RPB2